MKQLLRIDVSTRLADSHSRQMTDEFQKQWEANNPGGRVVVRDLVKNQVPHLSDLTIQGFYTPDEAKTPELKQALSLSDELIAELKSSDAVVIGIPMYNFGIPSSLKAYIDHVSRINQTFSIDDQGQFVPLVKNVEKMYLITSAGAVFSSPQMQPMNFLAPYLKIFFGFIGIQQVEELVLEGTTMDAVVFESSKEIVRKQILELA